MGDALGERRVEHECLGIGVVEEVPQLVVEVPVVDVDRHAANLECPVLRLEVLVPVVHVQPDLGVMTKTGRGVRGGESCGAVVVLGPCPDRGSVHHSGRLWNGVGDGLPDGGVVQLHGGERR